MIISRSNSCPECGDDHENSCYIIYDNGYKCFSCGASNYKSTDFFAFRELKTVPERNLFVPEHTTDVREFSLTTLSWLYDFYMTDDIIRQYRIAYCQQQSGKPESLLLPVLSDGNGDVLEYQRRFFPKNFYSSSNVKKITFIAGQHVSGNFVIVEDFVSAVRVGQFCNCLCLFGTSLTELNKKWLGLQATKVLLWLDNDIPGITASSKIEHELMLHYNRIAENFPLCYKETEIQRVFTEKSPKELSNDKIKKIISQYL